jgi:tetratricopeptide (TPR) repeat protein
MAYHEEEQLKIKRIKSKQAIALAMQGKWQEAIDINQTILEVFPDDVDAYNRLGRAYMENGVYAEARKAYEKSLKLDPYNAIAKKNLIRLSQLQEAPKSPKEHVHAVEPHFIEEAGKSGVVTLLQLASPKTLVRLVAGDQVYLKADASNLQVKSGLGEHIGQVEPRHAQRLLKLMKGGNKYSAAIISATENKVTVIIRETYQHPNLVGQPSFPPRWAEGLHQYPGDRVAAEDDDEEIEDTDYAAEEEADILPEDYSPTDEVENE